MTIPQILADAHNAELTLTIEGPIEGRSEGALATLAGNPSGLRTLARILTVMADAMADSADDPTPWSITLSAEHVGFFRAEGVESLTLRADP